MGDFSLLTDQAAKYSDLTLEMVKGRLCVTAYAGKRHVLCVYPGAGGIEDATADLVAAGFFCRATDYDGTQAWTRVPAAATQSFDRDDRPALSDVEGEGADG